MNPTVRQQHRVFLSYAHDDRAKAEALAHLLADTGMLVLWDSKFAAGADFGPQVEKYILNCHVFVPLLTRTGLGRPWLNQEIGFARALGKPILPVTFGTDPPGMIANIQAVALADDLSDAALLTPARIERAVREADRTPAAHECTENNERRARLLAEYARSVSDLGHHAMVRQKASLTSFHLPLTGPGDRRWREYFPIPPNDAALFEALREERETMGEHAEHEGCALIVDPFERLAEIYPPQSVRARVEGLLAFLETASSVAIAVNDDRERYESLTLVGDWCSSIAISSEVSRGPLRTRTLKEALFTRHPPTVRRQVRDFDLELEGLWRRSGWTRETCRERALDYYTGHLRRLV